MKFLSLKVENFMALAEANVDLNERGLVLIQGVNTDDTSASSNGAGKSTLMNALMWCLYGETATGYKGDDVLSTGNEKNCRVQVNIEDEGKQYAIIRHRNHKEFKNRLIVRGEDGDMTKGKDSLTQGLVEQLIGSSKEVFMASIYASQEAMPDLPGMTDKNLKAIVEEAAGVDRLTRAYAVARERSNAAAVKVDNIRTRMDGSMSLVEATELELSAARASADGWEKSRGERLVVARETQAHADVLLAEAELEIGSVPVAIAAKEAEIATERSKLSSKDEHDKKLARVRGIVASAEANLRSSERDKQAALNRATGFKNKAEGVVAQIGRPCTTCGKPYCEDDLSTVKESFIGQARTEVTQAQAFSKTMAEQQTILERAREAESSLASSSPDVSAITTRIEQLTRDLAGLRHRSGELSKVETEAKKASSLVESVISEINPFLETISRHEANLHASKNKYAELKRDLKDHEKQAVLLDKARQVFSPAGVRSHILTSVTPFLNARTAEYLNTLSDGNITAEWSTMEATKKGEYRDKFNISVVKAGASKNFAGLSGGEKRKARLACCLALQDLVASRASKNIQLFIGDEIDDALDSAGLERLMGILESKARERGTVMIVSHKEMKSWFRETLTVEVKGGRSYVH